MGGPLLGGQLPPGLERTQHAPGLHGPPHHEGVPRGAPGASDPVAASLPDDVFGREVPPGGMRAPEQLPAQQAMKAGQRPGGAGFGGGAHHNLGSPNPGQGLPGQPPRGDGGGSRRGRGGGGRGGRGFANAHQGGASNASRPGGRGGRSGPAEVVPGAHIVPGGGLANAHMAGGGHAAGARRHAGDDGVHYDMQMGPSANPAGGRGAGRGRGEGGRAGGRGRGRERSTRGAQGQGQGMNPNSPGPGMVHAQPRPQWLPLPPKAAT